MSLFNRIFKKDMAEKNIADQVPNTQEDNSVTSPAKQDNRVFTPTQYINNGPLESFMWPEFNPNEKDVYDDELVTSLINDKISDVLNGPDTPAKDRLQRIIGLISFAFCGNTNHKPNEFSYSDSVNYVGTCLKKIDDPNDPNSKKYVVDSFSLGVMIPSQNTIKRYIISAPDFRKLLKYTYIPENVSDASNFDQNKTYLESLL